MRNLIKADLKRILSKKGLYASLILMILITIFPGSKRSASEQIESYKTLFNTIGLTIMCIPIFLSVYGDELRSGTMITTIGMGLHRHKLVKAKLWVCTILLLGSYIILYGTALFKLYLDDLVITEKQSLFLFIYCLYCVIRGVGIFALSSLVLFVSMSAAGGMLMLVLAGMASSPILKGFQEQLKFPVYDISYMGLLDASFASFQAGGFGGTLIVALIYLAIVIYINVKLFDRKELNL